VDSLLKQTYKNLEIILVDDGSKDESGRLCDEYAHKDKRICAIHQTNMGLSGARNTGIDNANGEYIAFLDSDDYVSEHIYERLYDCMESHGADISMCRYERFSGDFYRRINEAPLEITEMDTAKALENIYSMDGETFTVAWNKLYKRSVIADIRYPLKRLNEDEFTTYKFIANASKLVYTNEILYYYFYNNNSITTKAGYTFNTDIYDALDERASYLEKRGFGALEPQIQKQYLDRIIMRNRKLWRTNKTETRGLYEMYRIRYGKVKGRVNGVGYKIYNISPTLYYLLLALKGN
jgi:glycosyltransferase involved in cell wall biosynthesis